jgi:hypothetical protein
MFASGKCYVVTTCALNISSTGQKYKPKSKSYNETNKFKWFSNKHAWYCL